MIIPSGQKFYDVKFKGFSGNLLLETKWMVNPRRFVNTSHIIKRIVEIITKEITHTYLSVWSEDDVRHGLKLSYEKNGKRKSIRITKDNGGFDLTDKGY